MPDNNYLDHTGWPEPVTDPDGTLPAREPDPRRDAYWEAWQWARGESAGALIQYAIPQAETDIETLERRLERAQGRLAGLRDGLRDHHIRPDNPRDAA